jgi:hypothetical protein
LRYKSSLITAEENMEKYYYISRRQNETNDENDLSYLSDVLGERAREIRRAVPHVLCVKFLWGSSLCCVISLSDEYKYSLN